MSKPKIVVVMPAYNAAKTLEQTYRDIPSGSVDQVLLVDDASADSTVEEARRLDLIVFVHAANRGYGGNQKTCYTQALRLGADIVVMLHPDYQYDPKRIPDIVAPIKERRADLVLGSRLLDGKALSGGMPIYKFISNRFLTTVENMVLGQRLSEMHTGYRAYSRRFLETVPFLRNSIDFAFDTEILFQAVRYKLRIEPPDEPMYLELFRAQCAQKGLVYDEGEILAFVRALLGSGRALAACQPRDLLEQVIDHAVYRGERPALTGAALQRASATYFARFR